MAFKLDLVKSRKPSFFSRLSRLKEIPDQLKAIWVSGIIKVLSIVAMMSGLAGYGLCLLLQACTAGPALQNLTNHRYFMAALITLATVMPVYFLRETLTETLLRVREQEAVSELLGYLPPDASTPPDIFFDTAAEMVGVRISAHKMLRIVMHELHNINSQRALYVLLKTQHFMAAFVDNLFVRSTVCNILGNSQSGKLFSTQLLVRFSLTSNVHDLCEFTRHWTETGHRSHLRVVSSNG